MFDWGIIVFFCEIVLLYASSRMFMDEWYYLLHTQVKNTKTVFRIIALFFLPGTIIHELSHFFSATLLFLRVHEVVIFPSYEGNRLNLGHVIYERADFIRSILVGVAPFFGAMGVFIMIGKFNLFPGHNLLMTVGFGYLIFTIAIQMFSSREDLVDLIYLVPFGIISYAVFYFFQIDIHISLLKSSATLLDVIKQVQFYIETALILCVAALVLFKSLRKVATK